MTSDDPMLRTVEDHLDEQAEMLSCIRSLIEDKIPFAEWATSEQAAFTAALQPPEGVSQFEAMKARNLARHLFRQDIEGHLPLADEFDRFDLADRIRADLAGLVRLGAGRHLREESSTWLPATPRCGARASAHQPTTMELARNDAAAMLSSTA